MAEDPTELQVLLRIVEVIDRRMQAQGALTNAPVGGYLANIVNNFIASEAEVRIESGGIEMGDSYTVSQAGVVGPHATARDISFTQIWSQTAGGIDLGLLRGELAQLRSEMSSAAESEPEQYLAIAEIASAQRSAAADDGPAVMKHLRQAGSWALEVAKTAGVDLAVTAMKSAMGL